MLYRPNSKWTWIYFLSSLIDTAVAISLAGATLAIFRANMKANNNFSSRISEQFAVVLMVGLIYRLILVYDTLAQSNIVGALGVCAYSIILCIFTSLQYQQINLSFQLLVDSQYILSLALWGRIKGLLISVAVTTGCFTLWSLFLIWKFRKDFSWEAFLKVNADLDMQLRYRLYQALITILKFDLFFLVGFIVQLYIAIAPNRHNLYYFITVSALPMTCVMLLLTAFFVRHEYRAGTAAVLMLQFGLLAYGIGTIYLLYSEETFQQYLGARPTHTFFGVLFLLLLCGTIAMTCACFQNFHKGLKPYIASGNQASLLEENYELRSRKTYTRIVPYGEP